LHHDVAAPSANFRNPFRSRIVQTSRPERTRSLANLYLKPGNENFCMTALLDFAGVGGLEEQLYRFLKVVASGLDCVPLAGYIQFRAQRNIPTPFAFDDRGDLLDVFHVHTF